MVKNLSFRARLLWSFLLLIVISLVLPMWYSGHVVTQDLQVESETDAERLLRLVGRMLEKDLHFNDTEALNQWFKVVGTDLHVRLTYIADSGKVMADSDVLYRDLGHMDNHSHRPEVMTAMSGKLGLSSRYSDTLGTKLIYIADRISPSDGLPDGILRIAMPVATLMDRKDRLIGNLLIGVALTFILALPLCWVITRYLGRQIQNMTTIATAIGEGDYNRRMLFYPGREFSPLANSINKMAQNIRGQIHTITEQNQQLEAILESMKEGVMVLDTQGRIRSFNKAMVGIFPKMAGGLGKRPIEVVVDSSLQQACDAALTAKTAEDSRMKTMLIEPDGSNVYDVSIVPLAREDTDLGAVAVFHDISELKHLERVRRDFVANVSHELRTPLTSIKGYAETLLDNEKGISKASARFLEVILKNANHMTKIVGDLLSLSRLEAGRQKLEIRKVDAGAAVNSAFRECQPLADDRNITLTNEITGDKLWVIADFDRLVQVFRNLVENSIRYSPEKSHVSVGTIPEEDRVVLWVKDDGPGIPRNEQERIFERFYRLESHSNRLPGSSGLGLAITKHIIEGHGGEIWLQSPVEGTDKGAVFFFSLMKPNRNNSETEAVQT
ncbi:MAG: ATP-binding protein [Desulfovibrio sp.]|uniref:HAMP domain-containing sensor histidine kinase n=1 Tax=Desulfovibrio sp. 7SRBS1 TaxID=3378064 RepID=UPI003B3DD773